MSPPAPISCNLHDYLEIACLYGYQLRLWLKNGTHMDGQALDLVTVQKREYLLLQNSAQAQIELTELTRLEVLTPNAKFSELCF